MAAKNQPPLPTVHEQGKWTVTTQTLRKPSHLDFNWLRTLSNLSDKVLAKPWAPYDFPRTQSKMGRSSKLPKENLQWGPGTWSGERVEVQEHPRTSSGRAAWNVKSTLSFPPNPAPRPPSSPIQSINPCSFTLAVVQFSHAWPLSFTPITPTNKFWWFSLQNLAWIQPLLTASILPPTDSKPPLSYTWISPLTGLAASILVSLPSILNRAARLDHATTPLKPLNTSPSYS